MSEDQPSLITSGGHVPTAADVIIDFILANTPGSAFGTDVFSSYDRQATGIVRFVEEAPNNVGITMGRAVAWEEPLVIVTVRGDPGKFRAPKDEAMRLRYLIGAIKTYSSRGITVQGVTPLAGPRQLGRDLENREAFELRFTMMAGASYE